MPGHKVHHHIFQRVFLHLPVRDGDLHFRHQLAQGGCEAVDIGHAVVEEIHLPLAVLFAQDGITDQRVGIINHIGLNRVALLWRAFQQAQIAHAHHAHVQGAGDGRGRKGQHVHPALVVLDPFLVRDAETLLLVDDQKAQVLHVDVPAQQPVRADKDIQFTPGSLCQHLFVCLGGAETADIVYRHREAFKALLDGLVVLLHQNGGRGQEGDLL